MGSRRQFTPGTNTTERSLESLVASKTADIAPFIAGQRHATRQQTAINLQGPEALEQRQLMTHMETVVTPQTLDFSAYPSGTIASGTRATLPTLGPTELVSGDHVNPVVISNGAFTPRPGVMRENLMVRFMNGNQLIESVTISPVGSGANNTFVWTLTTQGVEKFIAAPAGGGIVRIADSVGYIAVVPGPGSNYAINNITINNTTQRLVYDSPAEENQAVQDVTSSYTNLLGLATNRAITSSEIHANIVGLGSNTTTLTNRQTAIATLQAAVSTTRNQSKNSANIEALQLLESNLQAYAAPLAARYSILHPSHLENYQEDVSNNFSTFPSGSIPSGTNATLANFGKTEVVSGNHVQNVRIVDGKLSSLPGTIAENLMVHFLDDNQLVTSVTVGATSQANSSKLWVMTKNNVETFIPMPAAGGVIAVNKNVSFIAVVPGPGGVYSIDSITTTVTKQRVVYDAVNPFDVDDIDGCSALISTQLDAYITFCQSPDMTPGLQENDGHGILALDRLSARLEKLTALLDQQTRLMALLGTTPSQSQLAAAATNNDRLSSFNDAWQHDNRALQYRLTGVLTDEGRMNDMRTTVLPAMVGPASQGEVAALSTGVPELGGTLTISALRSGTSSPATFTSSYQNVITSGRLTTIDLSSVASTVTNVSFTLAASKPTTVTFLRGETVLSAQLVNPGSIASYGDESGITGVIIEHALTPLSQLAQDALHDINYGKTRLERIWDLRENRNEHHDTLVEQMNSYLDQKGISLAPAERTALLAELVQGGPLASGVTVSNLTLEGLQGYSLLENTGGLRIASNGVLAAMAGKIESADNPYDMSIANNSSIYFPRGGDVVRNAMGWYMQVPNQNTYTRFDVHGPAEIGGVFYSGSNSWQALSPDYYEILGQSIIVKPGAPAGVIISIRSCSGVYNITTKSGSQERESVTPPQELTIATDYQGVFTQPIENPGFTPGIVDTSGMKPQRVMLANGLMVMKFENIGQAGGTIRTEIYTGYASNVRAQKIGDFTTAVSPNVPVTLKANVSSPNIPSTGNEPAIITIVTTLPNGQEKVDTIAVNRTGNNAMVVKRGKEVPRPYSEEEQRRLVSAERKIAEAMKNIDPSINIATLQQRYAVLYDLFGSSTAIAKQTTIAAAATNKVADPTTAPPSSGVALFALNKQGERVKENTQDLNDQIAMLIGRNTATDYLALNVNSIRQQLSSHLSPVEIDAALAYLQKNPDLLVETDPQAFRPILVASSGSPAEYVAMAARSDALKKSAVLKLIISSAASTLGFAPFVQIPQVNDWIYDRINDAKSVVNVLQKEAQNVVMQELQDTEKRTKLIASSQTGPLMKFGLALENLASASVVVGIQGSTLFADLMDMVTDSAGGDLAKTQLALMDPNTPFISKPFLAINALGSSSTIVVSQIMKHAVPGNLITLALYTMSIPVKSLNVALADSAGLRTAIQSKALQAIETNPKNAKIIVSGAEQLFAKTQVAEQTMARLDILSKLVIKGDAPWIRVEAGGAQAAQEMFNKLIVGGEKIITTDYPGIIYKFADGSRIGLRLKSTSGPPAIDIFDLPFAFFKRIHFIP